MDDNHRRTISTTLGLLDQMLCEFQELASAPAVKTPLYERMNQLTPKQQTAINAHIATMRQLLDQMRRDLQLDARREDVATTIWSRASAFCEYLMELEGKHLRAYGEVPPDLAAYLEPKARQLVDRLRRIADATRPTQG